MSQLPANRLPGLKELEAIFRRALGDETFKLGPRSYQLLLAWESKIREEAVDRTSTPTGEPHRWRLPDERHSCTHRFKMVDMEGLVARCPKCNYSWQQPIEYKAYLTMGLYPDGQLGELFCEIAKQGSFVSGIMDALTFTMSVALQHGVPLEAFTKRFRYTKFEPSGPVEGVPKGIQGLFGSILDYMAAFLTSRFPMGHYQDPAGVGPVEPSVEPPTEPPGPVEPKPKRGRAKSR